MINNQAGIRSGYQCSLQQGAGQPPPQFSHPLGHSQNHIVPLVPSLQAQGTPPRFSTAEEEIVKKKLEFGTL